MTQHFDGDTAQAEVIPTAQAAQAIALAVRLDVAARTVSDSAADEQVSDPISLLNAQINGVPRAELIAAVRELGIPEGTMNAALDALEPGVNFAQRMLKRREELGLAADASQIEVSDEATIRSRVSFMLDRFGMIENLFVEHGAQEVAVNSEIDQSDREFTTQPLYGRTIHVSRMPYRRERDAWSLAKRLALPFWGYAPTEATIESPALRELIESTRAHGLGVIMRTESTDFRREKSFRISISSKPGFTFKHNRYFTSPFTSLE